MPELLTNLAAGVLLTSDELMKLIRSAPRRYKVYQIPKKAKGQMRTIAQPAREVKALQYWVMKEVLGDFLVHDAATGYRMGQSIADNAARHVNSRFLLKMDFEDFFPSLRDSDWRSYARKHHLQFTKVELGALTRILFWKPRGEKTLRLSIGAPSSPLLSNILLHEFDHRLSTLCAKIGVSYTRYADDLSLSANASSQLQEIEGQVIALCAKLKSPRLKINAAKAVRVSTKTSRRVTGLVLSNDRSVSLGRNEKRRIRASVHYFVTGRLSSEERGQLRGMLGFVKSVEPRFLNRLRRKFGPEVVREIQRS